MICLPRGCGAQWPRAALGPRQAPASAELRERASSEDAIVIVIVAIVIAIAIVIVIVVIDIIGINIVIIIIIICIIVIIIMVITTIIIITTTGDRWRPTRLVPSHSPVPSGRSDSASGRGCNIFLYDLM